jgi:hypothetical protein
MALGFVSRFYPLRQCGIPGAPGYSVVLGSVLGEATGNGQPPIIGYWNWLNQTVEIVTLEPTILLANASYSVVGYPAGCEVGYVQSGKFSDTQGHYNSTWVQQRVIVSLSQTSVITSVTREDDKGNRLAPERGGTCAQSDACPSFSTPECDPRS